MRLLICVLVFFTSLAFANENATIVVTEQSLVELFNKIEEDAMLAEQKELAPVLVILQQDVIRLFDRKAYRVHKELVDHAARLSAFGYVDLRVGLREITFMHLEKDDLPSFFSVEKNETTKKKST